MWRGLMLTKAVEQFLRDVHWGELDDLLIDMPPGTGDVQMGLARLLPRAEMLIVTTPALAAQKVAQRAADMARRSFVRVVGVIENMTDFTCAHGDRVPLFGAGGGQALADAIGAPLLGQVPLEPAVSAGGDAGRPVALDDVAGGPAARGVHGDRRPARRGGAAGAAARRPRDGRVLGPPPGHRRDRPRRQAVALAFVHRAPARRALANKRGVFGLLRPASRSPRRRAWRCRRTSRRGRAAASAGSAAAARGRRRRPARRPPRRGR